MGRERRMRRALLAVSAGITAVWAATSPWTAGLAGWPATVRMACECAGAAAVLCGVTAFIVLLLAWGRP